MPDNQLSSPVAVASRTDSPTDSPSSRVSSTAHTPDTPDTPDTPAQSSAKPRASTSPGHGSPAQLTPETLWSAIWPNTPPAQDVRQIAHPPSPIALYLRALMSSRKPARAQPMPSLAFERRNVPLDGDAIARYARLCGFSPDHGVPPTWPHLLAFSQHMLLMTDRTFPFAMLGMVHLANHNRQFARLSVGDRLDLHVQCGAMYAHDKGQVFTVLTTARRDGNIVWTGESLYLRTGVTDPLGAPYRSELRADATLVTSEKFLAPADLGRQYARVSGDYNPIHLWPLTAKLFGFERPIVHGMWSFARSLATVLPAQAGDQLDLLVEFKTPLRLPGEATLWRERDAHDSKRGKWISTVDTPNTSSNARPPTLPLGALNALPTPPLPVAGNVFELRDATGTVPHLRGRWQSFDAPAATDPLSTDTFDPDRS
ncbi:MaoC domain-containing protein dehydratase [Pandoraea pneumonica]|jgi:acyl dehydratase|uniref:MaoC domain-containing protein dehydratase n=1 Tax=Pandoraea pneumonica TaxID=2508299 RepID=A0A5E4RQK7_9BURK|nr:MaoC/PaaZ C-terminal domain-containing protein [Pandoraea pneumonica]VVD65690.1 MaoC domain-containing protein dehydratase [Pandoraea pneumonica]